MKRKILAFIILAILPAMAESGGRQQKMASHPDVVFIHGNRTVAISSSSLFGGRRIVFLDETRPRVAVYIRDQTRSQPQRAILRVWRFATQ